MQFHRTKYLNSACRCTLAKSVRQLPLWLILSIALVAPATGCTQEECLENKTSLPMAGFYDAAYPDQKVTLDSTAIYAEGVPGGVLRLDSARSASSISLPFNLEADHTNYIFEYTRRDLQRAAIRDTLRISYTLTPYFVSSACGVSYRMLISGLNSTHWLIDSVSAPQALVTNVEQQNIHVYFKVAHPEEDADPNLDADE